MGRSRAGGSPNFPPPCLSLAVLVNFTLLNFPSIISTNLLTYRQNQKLFQKPFRLQIRLLWPNFSLWVQQSAGKRECIKLPEMANWTTPAISYHIYWPFLCKRNAVLLAHKNWTKKQGILSLVFLFQLSCLLLCTVVMVPKD